MKITGIDLYSESIDEKLSFNFTPRNQFEKYMIRGITGLDSDELVPRFYGFGLQTGPNRYYDVGMKPREIAIRLALNPNYLNLESTSDLRDDLLRMISATRTGEISLRFNSGASAVAKLDGFIIKFESAYFEALPEVQLTIRCDDPILKSVEPVIYDGDLAEYPDIPLVQALTYTGSLTIPDKLSTAPHGFLIKGIFDHSTTGHFKIRDADAEADADWQFDIDYAFSVDDELVICSIANQKALYVNTPTQLYLMDLLSADSVWPVMFPGANTFYFDKYVSGGHAAFVVKRIEFYTSYWAV